MKTNIEKVCRLEKHWSEWIWLHKVLLLQQWFFFLNNVKSVNQTVSRIQSFSPPSYCSRDWDTRGNCNTCGRGSQSWTVPSEQRFSGFFFKEKEHFSPPKTLCDLCGFCLTWRMNRSNFRLVSAPLWIKDKTGRESLISEGSESADTSYNLRLESIYGCHGNNILTWGLCKCRRCESPRFCALNISCLILGSPSRSDCKLKHIIHVVLYF